MGGQGRDTADDGSHRVTIGSVDDVRYPEDTFYINQQDNQGNHMTSIFDSQYNLLRTSYKGKGL